MFKRQIRSFIQFLDEKDFLELARCMLANSNLNVNQKFSILLCNKSRVNHLIVYYMHQKYFPLGPQALLFQLRKKIWPLSGQNICRKIVNNCITCCEVNASPYQQLWVIYQKKE